MTHNSATIEKVANIKANDYIEDLFVGILVKNTTNPVDIVKSMAENVATECKYSSCHVEPELADTLDHMIQKNVRAVLHSIAHKARANI